MTRLRMTVTFEYDANPADYGTDDPHAMAAVDMASVDMNGPAEWLEWHEDNATVAIEPVEDGAK